MFHAPRERILISGDALWEDGFGVLFPQLSGRECTFAETRRTLDSIAALDLRLVIPGHGEPFEAVARQNGKGIFGRFEYSHGLGQHWRLTTRLAVFQGDEAGFLGQYDRNSFASLALRYSF